MAYAEKVRSFSLSILVVSNLFICFPPNSLSHVLSHSSVLAYAVPATSSLPPQITPVHLLHGYQQKTSLSPETVPQGC